MRLSDVRAALLSRFAIYGFFVARRNFANDDTSSDSSAMTQLFEQLIAGGAPAVRALKGKHEGLELDFKQRTAVNRAGDKADKKVLGKALSAFANSMGGLIVWGIDCKRDADGVDQVVGFVPVDGLARSRAMSPTGAWRDSCHVTPASGSRPLMRGTTRASCWCKLSDQSGGRIGASSVINTITAELARVHGRWSISRSKMLSVATPRQILRSSGEWRALVVHETRTRPRPLPS